MKKNRPVPSLITNIGLLLTCSAAALSGLVIQLNYHMGHHGAIDKTCLVFGMTYAGWFDIHLSSIVLVSLFAAIHVFLHWKWYKTIGWKKMFVKNNPVIMLTIVFIVAATTGYIPLFIRLNGGSEVIRKAFIEIHDKITFVLLIYLVIHVAKRLRWFIGNVRGILQNIKQAYFLN